MAQTLKIVKQDTVYETIHSYITESSKSITNYEEMIEVVLDMIKDGHCFLMDRDILRDALETLTYMYEPNDDMNKETQANSSSSSKYYQTVALSRALTITNSTAAAGGASSWPDEDGEKTPSSIFGRGKMFVENALASFKSGINQRLEADKNFVFKLLTEICIDELITLSVLIWVTGLNSEAWTPTIRLAALVQMLSAALNDTLIVYFLAPNKCGIPMNI